MVHLSSYSVKGATGTVKLTESGWRCMAAVTESPWAVGDGVPPQAAMA